MKSLFIAAGVATLAISASATASVFTLGGPLAQSCYNAAEGGDPRASAIEGCTRALTEEGLLASDRAATYVNRGIVQMVGGHDDAADADFDSALAINASLFENATNPNDIP